MTAFRENRFSKHFGTAKCAKVYSHFSAKHFTRTPTHYLNDHSPVAWTKGRTNAACSSTAALTKSETPSTAKSLLAVLWINCAEGLHVTGMLGLRRTQTLRCSLPFSPFLYKSKAAFDLLYDKPVDY